MNSAATTARGRPFPGVVWGDYPQRETPPLADSPSDVLRNALRFARAQLGMRRVAPYARFAAHVARRAASLPAGPAARAELLQTLRTSWPRQGDDAAARLQACALAASAMQETLGVQPYATQLIAAAVMLDDRLAEMATGEGKTLAIALAAAAGALGGSPVHVVTANDYLAARDAAALAPFFAALGVSVGVVTQPLDQASRRRAYGCDVCYCTARELVFDYLRDGLSRPRQWSDLARRAARLGGRESGGAAAPPLLRGLCMAIIDEADTVLIDEERVPLVLSLPGDTKGEADFLKSALACARTLLPGRHFELPAGRGQALLLEAGRQRVQAWAFPGGALHGNQRHRDDAVALAVAALQLQQRDRDYVVRDGQVQIIDESTGRAAPGRAWSRGLHQLVELKEGLAPTVRNETVSQITYQRFFRRYVRLAGMSGTVSDAAGEMAEVYGLAGVRVPLRLPSRRQQLPLRLFADEEALWPAVVNRIAQLHLQGRPVLAGTNSVAESERLSALLHARGLGHAVLNARQDQDESEIIAQAGQAGRITVATSMAGRGSDIALGPGVAMQGGLHVIMCQHNGSRRIDRQFAGRCARQGEPGSVETLLATSMPLFERWLPAPLRRWLARGTGVPQWARRVGAFVPQWLEQKSQRAQRRLLCRQDELAERELTFARHVSIEGKMPSAA